MNTSKIAAKKKLGKVISIDEGQIKSHLGEIVRDTVEETLNSLLDAETDVICRAGRYERSADRQDTRAGNYNRKLHTKAGEVKLIVPKLRSLTFETSIIERYQRRELTVENITQALWGTRVSPGTVSNLNKKIYGKIKAWRNRSLKDDFFYAFLDGIYLKKAGAARFAFSGDRR